MRGLSVYGGPLTFEGSFGSSGVPIWEFPKIRGTFSWGANSKDPTIKRTKFGSPFSETRLWITLRAS